MVKQHKNSLANHCIYIQFDLDLNNQIVYNYSIICVYYVISGGLYETFTETYGFKHK